MGNIFISQHRKGLTYLLSRGQLIWWGQTPCLDVDVYQKGTTKGWVQVLPDSGSVVDIMSADLAPSLGLDLLKVQNSECQLTVANGQNISVSH